MGYALDKKARVIFRTSAAMAKLLEAIPHKSEFIRLAIAARLGIDCPVCNGDGIVSREVHDHFAPMVRPVALADTSSEPADAASVPSAPPTDPSP